MKMVLILVLMNTHMNMLKMRFNGALTETRSSIWNAFWRLFTSVVILVTRPAELNLSILENEKVWMLRNIASRRLRAKPDDAIAEKRPAKMPKSILIAASTSMMAPYLYTFPKSLLAMPSSMIHEVT